MNCAAEVMFVENYDEHTRPHSASGITDIRTAIHHFGIIGTYCER